jgi:prepilin-type N-terminal cleavage/methylation domain-containing protein
MARGDVMANGRRARSQRGFTLLELLITLSVTTIGLIGLLSLHLSVVRGNDGASRSAEAQQLGVSRLEALRGMRLTDMMTALTGKPDVVLPTVPVSTPVKGRGGMTFTVTSSAEVTKASNSLIRVRVVTTWAEEGGTFGANGGSLDHSLAFEVIRTVEESL